MTQASPSKVKYLHSQNGRQKPLPRNRERDVVKMRELWYDQGIRIAGLLWRYEQHGWTQQQIEDVVYYRTYQALQARDVVWSIREANF